MKEDNKFYVTGTVDSKDKKWDFNRKPKTIRKKSV
jgi:hypothetical protein